MSQTQATVRIVTICEPLCFIIRKLGHIDALRLKNAIIDFYTCEQISNAKDVLVKYTADLKLDEWKCPPNRRKDSRENVGNKLRQDVEDIFNVLQFLDERKHLDKLPLFVAADPDLLPSTKLTEGDLLGLMNKFRITEAKLDEMRNDILTTMMAEIRSAFSSIVTPLRAEVCDLKKNVQSLAVKIPLLAAEITATAVSHRETRPSLSVRDGSSTRQAPAASPHPGPSLSTNLNDWPSLNDASDMETTSDDGARGTDNDFTTVSSRRLKKRKLVISPHSPANIATSYSNKASQPAAAPGAAAPRAVVPPSQVRKNSKRRILIGDAKSSSIKAASNLQVSKKVYKLGNIDESYTDLDLKNYIESLGIRVVYCSILAPRPKQPAGNRCFRVCVFATDAHKILTKGAWSSGVSVQEWYFKPKSENVVISTDNPNTAPLRQSHAVSMSGEAALRRSVRVTEEGSNAGPLDTSTRHSDG
jgi:hypothetical protein